MASQSRSTGIYFEVHANEEVCLDREAAIHHLNLMPLVLVQGQA